MKLQNLFQDKIDCIDNFIFFQGQSAYKNQQQTNDTFSDKWEKVDKIDDLSTFEDVQLKWYLELYGFKDVEALKVFLQSKKVIFDAGCGLGYKAAWFATLAPNSLVIAMDFSDSVRIAAKRYKNITNLYFIQGDIADTKFNSGVVNYVSCDQVIMHTEFPERTFAHLTEITSEYGEFACYVYSKKALPRELLDDYFRKNVININPEKIWELSRQLTQLGKTLSELKIDIEVPEIPLLNIKGGVYDLQRFIYWNFIKCFWREDWGEELCDSTNFDWYSPSNAKRYSEIEFKELVANNKLDIISFHIEEACYSGRFRKSK
jgi:ubiquinone/menaquinone biosynthesis C-methylase UbiE